jgi:hypothetical protein
MGVGSLSMRAKTSATVSAAGWMRIKQREHVAEG